MAGPIIMALDLARLCGVAVGPAGAVPRSYTVTLAGPREGFPAACGGLIGFLDDTLRAERPAIVAKEAAFSLAAFSDHTAAEKVVRSAYGLAAIVEGICHRWNIPCRDGEVSTVTKHFTGRGRHGGRDERKRAVIARCRLLAYVEPDCTDDNRCDALAVWDWAAANFARRPGPLALFAGAAA